MRRAALLLALSFAACAPAVAQAPSPTTPPDKIDPGPVRPESPEPPASAAGETLNVPASVFALRRAGEWEADGQKGFSRLLGLADGERQRFYAQWLTTDGKVVATKEVVDEEAAKLVFGDVRAERGDEGVALFLDTEPDKDGMRDTWVMVLGAPGDARFGPATN